MPPSPSIETGEKMKEDLGIFPFGEPVRKVEQVDRSPKKVFVLGVYASAVHARWIGADGGTLVRALAVASEPSIFWRGEGAEELISQVIIPSQIGRLVPASAQFTGPSGIALDEKILHPLKVTRAESWLCDLVPHACMNSSQEKAIKRDYLPLMDKYGLPVPTVPRVPKAFSDEERRQEIKDELVESGAGILILLGDQPIKWFLRFYDSKWRKLSDFGTAPELYGRLHQTTLDGLEINVLPLAHPRRVARLGRSSVHWYELHHAWLQDGAEDIELA
jgi:uracil-DNA glycosylase